MEAALKAGKEHRARLELEHTIHSGIKSPVQRIPPEIWGIIFGFVLGPDPFSNVHRRAYTFLRSVCTLWRQVASTTPGLCTGISIVLDDWVKPGEEAVQLQLQRKLSPWLAILNSNRPYELEVVEKMQSYALLSEQDREGIMQYLLATAPSPTTLTISSDKLISAALALKTRRDTVTFLELGVEPDLDIRHLEGIFPRLEGLTVSGFLNLDNPFPHPSLQSLTLQEFLSGSERQFLRLLEGLPCLRELKICASDIYEPDDDDVPSSAISFPSIEVLAVNGEDMAVILDYLTLPKLKFFGYETWGALDVVQRLERTFPEFFRRSHLANITVSMMGPVVKPLFATFVEGLPSNTRFHCSVSLKEPRQKSHRTSFCADALKEVLCARLAWLDGWIDLKPCAKSTKVFLAAESEAEKKNAESRRDQLGELGYALEVCSRYDIRTALWASIPRVSMEWRV
ncbi:hypothetical protein BKA70DRAFT_692688 [Coprinopsis sp. MPI-PUGE-AT-0042]|nr:hypothetical protein BKA70DRAFT_692688 [Coprinopsis sp. MPI-PUGE-AT-0042]